MTKIAGAILCASLIALIPEGLSDDQHHDGMSAATGPMTRVDRAIADLADRLDTAAAHISVELQEEVTWPDGSIGCPRKGMAYRQQLVNGSRLLLRVGETTYAYHAAAGGDYFLCIDPSDPLPSALSDR